MTSAPPVSDLPPARGGAYVSLRIGNAVALEANTTTTGLLAVAAIVTASLLGSAAIVLAARQRGKAQQIPHQPTD